MLFSLVFDVAGPAGSSSPVAFQRAELNEGQIGVQIERRLGHRSAARCPDAYAGMEPARSAPVPSQCLPRPIAARQVNGHGGACSEIDRWLNGGWDAHINNLPFNDFAVEPGKGYFLKCTATSQWTLEGFAFAAAVPVALRPGWNLIGLPHPQSGYTAQSMLDAIAAQDGTCSEVDRWLNGGWDAHIGGLPFNNFVVAPDRGYFVKCSQGTTFVPN